MRKIFRSSACSGFINTSISHSVALIVRPLSSGTVCLVRIWSSELRATESNGWKRPSISTGSLPNSREWKPVSAGWKSEAATHPARQATRIQGMNFFMAF